MRETIKRIAGGAGCCIGWALIIWAGAAWWQSAGRESEARAQAARVEQQIREANQWREQQEMIQYQMKLQSRENDRILAEQQRMLMLMAPPSPLYQDLWRRR